MDVRFHCSKKIRHSGKKAKHDVFSACPDICQVLRLNPYYGLSIPHFHHLRKMRLRVRGLNSGKRGGYRLTYRAKEMDQAVYIVFLETYFKGDREDLTHAEYKLLNDEADRLLSQPLSYDWE